ncbi:hypothetical protein [Sphaerisporangium corydalis]
METLALWHTREPQALAAPARESRDGERDDATTVVLGCAIHI